MPLPLARVVGVSERLTGSPASRRFAPFRAVSRSFQAAPTKAAPKWNRGCAALRRQAFATADLVAHFQSHIFNVRLDLDIDGPDNSFVPGHLHQR